MLARSKESAACSRRIWRASATSRFRKDIKRLLGSKPPAKGLVLPGMPAGSPGMEMADGSREPYTVELVHEDGRVEDFAKH